MAALEDSLSGIRPHSGPTPRPPANPALPGPHAPGKSKLFILIEITIYKTYRNICTTFESHGTFQSYNIYYFWASGVAMHCNPMEINIREIPGAQVHQ